MGPRTLPTVSCVTPPHPRLHHPAFIAPHHPAPPAFTTPPPASPHSSGGRISGHRSPTDLCDLRAASSLHEAVAVVLNEGGAWLPASESLLRAALAGRHLLLVLLLALARMTVAPPLGGPGAPEGGPWGGQGGLDEDAASAMARLPERRFTESPSSGRSPAAADAAPASFDEATPMAPRRPRGAASKRAGGRRGEEEDAVLQLDRMQSLTLPSMATAVPLPISWLHTSPPPPPGQPRALDRWGLPSPPEEWRVAALWGALVQAMACPQWAAAWRLAPQAMDAEVAVLLETLSRTAHFGEAALPGALSAPRRRALQAAAASAPVKARVRALFGGTAAPRPTRSLRLAAGHLRAALLGVLLLADGQQLAGAAPGELPPDGAIPMCTLSPPSPGAGGSGTQRADRFLAPSGNVGLAVGIPALAKQAAAWADCPAAFPGLCEGLGSHLNYRAYADNAPSQPPGPPPARGCCLAVHVLLKTHCDWDLARDLTEALRTLWPQYSAFLSQL
ncbi:hypothetical protein PAPYR_9443 [Paratrimastix pyriformis]|uniref:Uncharacterized protein n=1 Tax=Paratrimastix pyriformis TaxID=342808 RepID=A0ABQ8UBX6_9EUKA|nr:hypothetical protein PAPYR_9443 [Paratrimastix pyriformis]